MTNDEIRKKSEAFCRRRRIESLIAAGLIRDSSRRLLQGRDSSFVILGDVVTGATV